MIRPSHVVVLLILVAAAYVPALMNDFVYDDHGSIAENAFLEQPANLWKALSFRTLGDASVPDGRRPMVIVSYFLDRFIWGLRPFGYHLTNLLLHLLNVALLMGLIGRLVASGRSVFFAFAGAALFGLHPVLTEAVQSPAFREDLLSTCFILLFFQAALSRTATSWLAIPALLLALGSKESAAIAPILLLWLWISLPETRLPFRKMAALLLSSSALVAFFAVLWFRTGSLQASSPEWEGISLLFPANLFTAPWLWCKALKLLAWPHPLVADYQIGFVVSLADPRFLVGLLVILVSIAAALILLRLNRPMAFGLGWMMIAFIPVSNLVPLYNPFAERYLYLLAVGFAIIVARLLSFIPRASWRSILLAVLCAGFGFTTAARLQDWSNDLALWSRTLKQAPGSARAHTWVGLELKARGDISGALEQYTEANRLNPKDVSALINIGICYGEAGRLAQAEQCFREAIRRRPSKVDAYWNLTVALQKENRNDEALGIVRQVLEIDPRFPPALNALNLYTNPASPMFIAP